MVTSRPQAMHLVSLFNGTNPGQFSHNVVCSFFCFVFFTSLSCPGMILESILRTCPSPERGTGIPGENLHQIAMPMENQQANLRQPGHALMHSCNKLAESLVIDCGSSTTSSQQPAPPMALEVTKREAIQRPDSGGTSQIRSLDLLVNHFVINYDEESIIYHYELSIKPEDPSDNELVAVASIKNMLFSSDPDHFPSSSVAYDGDRNLYSTMKLPVGQFRVELHRRTFLASLELKKPLELRHLSDRPVPQEVLQGLGVIVREASVGQKLAFRRSLYSRRINPSCSLGRGIVALHGSQQTLLCTENGLMLRIDPSVMPFRRPGPVLRVVEECIGFRLQHNMQLNKTMRQAVEGALQEARVAVTHRRSGQRFIVAGLTGLAAEDILFRDENSGRQVRLLDYYRRKHGVEIKFRRLPCLDLSRDQMNYVPMELCEVVEGQKYPKDRLWKEEDRKLRSLSLLPPKRRKEKIMEVVNAADRPVSGELANQFKISITGDMIQVLSRVLPPPALKLLNCKGQSCKKILKDDCQWNLQKNKLLRPQRIDRWAILDFSAMPSHPRHERLDIASFIPNFVRRCHELGIHLAEQPLFIRPSGMAVLNSYSWLQEVLSAARCSEDGHPIDLLICPIADRHPGYKTLKLICETELGIITQCCLSFHANNTEKRDQFLANLALKINAKLGGTNAELFDGLPHIAADGRSFMLIGADVNHPSSRNTTSPSIAAVVATLNCPQSNRYISRVRAQPHRVERIIDIGPMCKELVDTYTRFNGTKPEKIIYFRDGVGDGQFDMVLNKELADLKAAIGSEDYSPTITVIVAQKRHHTRLFPKDDKVTRTGNVPPGTVVDTGIVDPVAFNFFLCSHYGSLGTSKPTHYYVLHDDHKFTSDEVQRLIYNLCFTFARCTKPVALVPPVYYADLVAYRGRLYYEGLSDIRSPGSTVSSTSSSNSSVSLPSTTLAAFEHTIFPRLHRNLENEMFYL